MMIVSSVRLLDSRRSDYGAGKRVPQVGHQQTWMPRMAWSVGMSSWWWVHAWRIRWMRMVSMMNWARCKGDVP
jgi:hypothetical protein